MSENSFEIDKAMNIIKDEIIKDMYDSVSRKNNDSYLPNLPNYTTNSVYSEKLKD